MFQIDVIHQPFADKNSKWQNKNNKAAKIAYILNTDQT